MKGKVAIVIAGIIGWTFVCTPQMIFAQDGNAQMAQDTQALEKENPEIAKKNGLVSIDFRDADIKNVLKVLAYNSGVNIVAGPEVTGLVTIQLKDVPWQKALDVVLSTYGYAYERKGDILSVTTVENLKKRREDALVLAEQEPLVTETFTLNFGKASEIIGSIEKMKTPRGSINFDQRTNTLIVTDIQGNIDLMENVVKALDAVTPQVVIEVKVVETTLTNTENMGIDWTVKGTAQMGKSPTAFPFKFGESNDFLSAFPSPAATEFSYGTLNASTLTAVLELLKTRSNTNILSNPKVVTLDNQMARIVVGSQYPIPTYTYNEQQAKLQVSGWQYKDIGIIFEVTPHVNNAGFVTIDLQPKITAILDFVTVENTQLPRLSTEEATTKVMIKDGDTLVIAGLIKDQVTDTKKRVPILGDIPVVGELFRKSETKKDKTELMIFLTPHIITPELKTATAGSKV
ncbi:MAG: type IV pilus secretin PilQ [Candidatus Omnitrophica bacterium]|nr:type IV pilus secretin PilQ [Candidatus Omnitrophota bacterium]